MVKRIAFWHNDEKELVEAILVISDDEGREINQILTIRKFDEIGDLNPDFEELLESVGEEKVDANTAVRKANKALEAEMEEQKLKAEQQARELELLFDAKIKVLEVEQIKNTTNKTLKSKLRRSKNQIELNMFAQLILMEELGLGFVTYESK